MYISILRCWLLFLLKEIEHRSVAFDVYETAVGDEKLRLRVMVQATFFFLLMNSLRARELIKRSDPAKRGLRPALRAANMRLERTDEDRRRFFADISHELRTPLTVILMEAQLGRQGAPDAQAAFATIETRAPAVSHTSKRNRESASGSSSANVKTPFLTAMRRSTTELQSLSSLRKRVKRT